MTHFRRSLTSELQHTLAVEPGRSKLDEDNIPQIMVEVCAGLVTVDEESNIIRLVHYTTQEYFERTRNQWFPDAESDIAKTCITYLSFSALESGLCETDNEFEEILESNKLYDYAASNWGHHARLASISSNEVMDFLQCEAKVIASSQALMAVKRHSWQSNYSAQVPRRITGRHLAAYFGIQEAVKAFLDEGLPDIKDSDGRTPLSWAAEKGHENVVELLLAKAGIDVNSAGKTGLAALSFAAENGHAEIVKMLLMIKSIDVNQRDSYGRTPLLWAAIKGHERVVGILLAAAGIKVNSKDEDGWTALSYAAENGKEVVEMLLAAAMKGHERVVELLLAAADIEVNSKDEDGWTALLFAAVNGYKEVVKMLPAVDDIDANSMSSDEYDRGRTALSFAAEKGREEVVKILLATDGVDINHKSTGIYNSGRTALSFVAGEGHEEIDSQDTTLHQWHQCQLQVDRLLLQNGANIIKSKHWDDWTPLWLDEPDAVTTPESFEYISEDPGSEAY
ncbi:uncharacterized protein N7496_011713 [Penicillium cataractarum]|uniref:Uncharacterized protein n=1 Tax=Penicillium cataractarum TaxID=2100454 RepID=A0A9W9RFL3_9EURO|nr:uncharacterized protein N7496_011713 [Penicillium cataractarum]KAJ5359300.1 hypothetical protein N7496_011713 [Penicillium cataractarum]